MKLQNKILSALAILFVCTMLSSCSIAVKAVYNQFSDNDEFVLFSGERKTRTANPKEEEEKIEPEKEGETDLEDEFISDSL